MRKTKTAGRGPPRFDKLEVNVPKYYFPNLSDRICKDS